MSDYTKNLKLAFEAGRRLMDNADYQLLVSELETELAQTWKALRESPTTDPKIAELQAKLRTLESVLGRAKEWVLQYKDNLKQGQQPPLSESDDYDIG